MFVFWFVGRIMLFLWFFNHMWQHQLQIADLRKDVQLLVATVPPLLFMLNVFWFGKIVKGLVKLVQGQHAKVGCLIAFLGTVVMLLSPSLTMLFIPKHLLTSWCPQIDDTSPHLINMWRASGKSQ